MITFYGYKRCGTSRKGEKFLTDNNIDFNFIDITLTPPGKDELASIVEKSGKPIKKFFNTSGVSYRENNMKEKLKTMNESDMLDALASDGKLIKRPLVTDGENATVGFSEAEFIATWQ